MAEAATEKAQTLAEQYFVNGDEKKLDLSTKTAEVKEVENPKEVSVAVAVEQGVEVTTVVSPAVAETSSEDTPAAAAEESNNATEENSGDQEAEETEEFKLETAPIDFRFPTTNQTRHCFTRYIEHHRCTAARGEGAPECDKFAKYYRSLCPGEWIDKWNEQRENGTFPGPLQAD